MFEVWTGLTTAIQALTEQVEPNGISRGKGWGDMEVGVQYRRPGWDGRGHNKYAGHSVQGRVATF
jgi:hypothetical protein